MREISRTLSVLVLLCAPALLAQPMEFARGQKVVLRASTDAMKMDTASRDLRYVADVAVVDSGLTINGDAAWPAAGMPDFKRLEIRRMGPGKSGYEVELRRESGVLPVLLLFADQAAAAKALPQLLIRDGDTTAISTWTEHVNAALADKVFSGPLAKVPAEARKALLDLEHKQRLGHFTSETFKEHDYLQINTGESENVYNTLKMNRSQRMARGAAELLPVLKAVHRALGNCEAIYGIKVTTLVPYKNFVTEGDSGSDRIAIYAPCESVAKFANADISGQKLLDESIILVNGDRSEVSLSAE